MDDEPNGPPDEEEPVERGGAAEPQHDMQLAAVTSAINTVQRIVNASEAVRAETASAAFDAMLLDEEARGAPVEVGDLVERAMFDVEAAALTGWRRTSCVAASCGFAAPSIPRRRLTEPRPR